MHVPALPCQRAPRRRDASSTRIPALPFLPRAPRRIFFLDVVAEVAPRRRRSREAPPYLAGHAVVFERAGGELDHELALARVVARRPQAAAAHPLHFHRSTPSRLPPPRTAAGPCGQCYDGAIGQRKEIQHDERPAALRRGVVPVRGT